MSILGKTDSKQAVSFNEVPETSGQESRNKNDADSESQLTQETSDYHAMATVAGLLGVFRDENKTNKLKKEKQQYTYMEFIDKKTGEVLTQRVLF